MSHTHRERHWAQRAPWLRAAVLGADDGLVSTASLLLGVAAAQASTDTILTAGLAGLAAGAMSMAAGEYVSVSSQRDTELADLEREKRELALAPEAEERELAGIYEQRGLEPALAEEVARALSKHARLESHARDELGLNIHALSRPAQASFVSAASFAVGAVIPVTVMAFAPLAWRIEATVISTFVGLAASGAFGAYLGGSTIWKAAVRVLVGGGLAMATTTLVGRLAAIVL